MATYTEITTLDQWNEWKADTEPVLLFKHSTTCPVSAEALKQFESFLTGNDSNPKPILVKVIESRPVSNQVAEETKVKHESPQAILLHEGEVLWHASHWNITSKSLKEAVGKL